MNILPGGKCTAGGTKKFFLGCGRDTPGKKKGIIHTEGVKPTLKG